MSKIFSSNLFINLTHLIAAVQIRLCAHPLQWWQCEHVLRTCTTLCLLCYQIVNNHVNLSTNVHMYLYTTYVISAYHHLRGEFESSSSELYSIQHRVTCGRSVDSSTNKTDHHDIAEILLKVALDTITITQVVHDIILFINSSSKTYTPSRISSTRLYTSSSCSCYSCARLCSFHNNNGSATSPKTK